MVSNTTQHPPTPPSHTLFVNTLILTTEKGGAVTREKGRGETGESTDQSWDGNTNMTDNGYLQSINSVC
jgi:hypothetical protein